MESQETQVLEYFKKITHIYVIGDKYIWCVEKQKTHKIHSYKTLVYGNKKRCGGCGMVIGK